MRYMLQLKPGKPLGEMTDYELINWIEICRRWLETIRITLNNKAPDLASIALVGEQLNYGSAELIKRWKHKQGFS